MALTGCLTGGGPGQAGSASPAPEAAGGTVIVKDFAFVPAKLEVKAGSTVTWKFERPPAHTSTADPGGPGAWDSGGQGVGKTFGRTFDEAGTFPYHCQPHPFMKATIVVE